MKLSKKEKILLCALGIGVGGYLYYDMIYAKQVEKIAEKMQQVVEIESKYNYAVESIDNIIDKTNQKVILNAKIDSKTDLFYPTISQEHIIVELNKLISESGLKATYTFESIEVKAVEAIEKKQVNNQESSLTTVTDEYNHLQTNPEEVINGSSNNTENTTGSVESNTVSTDSASADASTSVTSGEKIEQLKCTLSFSGEYSALNDFLNTLKSNQRKIVVNNISLSQKTLTEISGSMTIEFYALPKLNDEIETYLNWAFENVYGKEVPFSTDAASGNIEVKNKITSDFIASIKSETSVLPTVIIGKSNDNIRTTYAYANSNSEEIVELVISEENDKYYYKYKTSKDNYPSSYSGLGEEFTPISDNIVIDILSESRNSGDDNSALKLSIVNNTDKLVKVNISGDDSSNPRVTVDGDGSKISVSKK